MRQYALLFEDGSTPFPWGRSLNAYGDELATGPLQRQHAKATIADLAGVSAALAAAIQMMATVSLTDTLLTSSGRFMATTVSMQVGPFRFTLRAYEPAPLPQAKEGGSP